MLNEPQRRPQKRLRRAWTLAWPLLVLCGVLGAHLWLYAPYTADDAFISFRYARQFALGHGLVFNIGEQVEGYSTFSWVLLLGTLNYFGFDIPLAAKMINLVLVFGVALTLAAWSLRRQDAPDRLPWAALLLATDGAFGYWGANGMEVPLVTALLLVAGIVHLRELQQPGRLPFSALAFAALALSRPEGALFWGLAATQRVFDGWHRADGWASLWGRIGRDWRWYALFAVIVGLFLMWRHSYYGAWLPNTVAVKSGIRPRSLLEGVLTTFQFVGPRAAVLVLIGVGLWAAGWRTWPRWVVWAALLLAGNTVFVVLAGGDWMPYDRFWVVILPWLYALLAWSLPQIGRRIGRGDALVAVVAAFLMLVQLGGSLVAGLTTSTPAINNAGPFASRWLRHVAHPGDVVASSNIGAIGYYNMELVIVDMVGLTDAHIAHTPARFPGGLLGRGDGFGHWDSAYVLSRQPRFIEIAGVNEAEAQTWGGRAAWAGADDLYRNEEFRRRYRYAGMSYFQRIDLP